MSTIAGLLKLIRPRQWTKNVVCLSGVFFGGHVQPQYVVRALLAAAAFCAASSFVYIVNDILDRDRDRLHPRKRLRPIASRQVTVGAALAFSVPVLAVALGLGGWLHPDILLLIACYIVLNLFYSFVLKDLSLVDGMVVATGFVLRVYVGTVAVSVLPSAWLLLCTLFLSLFLAFGKRRAEINAAAHPAVSGGEGLHRYPGQAGAGGQAGATAGLGSTRGVLRKYTVVMLDRFCNICATLTIAVYALFTVFGHEGERTYIVTLPPVVMGLFRYILLVERYSEGEAPDAILLKDWAIQLAIVIWGILYVSILYGHLHLEFQ